MSHTLAVRRLAKLLAVAASTTGLAVAPSLAAEGPVDDTLAPPPLRTLAVTSANVLDGRLVAKLSCTADGTVTAAAAGRRVDRRRFRCSAGRARARLRVPPTARRLTLVARSAGQTVRRAVGARAQSSWLAANWWATLNCDGYSATAGVTGMMGSTLVGGDTYTLRFALYRYNHGYLTGWSAWQGPYAIRQQPGQSLVTRSRLYNLPPRVWVAVRMQVFSRRLNRVIRDEWLPARAGSLAEDNGGAYCRTLI